MQSNLTKQTKFENKKLKVCCISDTHGFHDQMEDLGEGDILIHAGDFTFVGDYDEIKKFVDWFSKQKYKHKILIGGNHEKTLDMDIFQKILFIFYKTIITILMT